jgi:ATP-binding cassette, subfamily C (CFTR/MRP), member 4
MIQKEHRQKPKNPHNDANRLSKLSFWWLRSLYRLGLTRTITEDDVYETLKEHQSERISAKFIRLWNDELSRKDPSVLRMFYNAYGFWTLIFAVVFSVIESLNLCAQPLFLGALLNYFVDVEVSKGEAYFYASGIVVCSLFLVISFHLYCYYVAEIEMRLRIGCSRLVYDKVN